MALEVGIVGLPNVGKSTLFNALTAAGALAANYPFATIDPNVGIVNVPDPRLETIRSFIPTEKNYPRQCPRRRHCRHRPGGQHGRGIGQ